MYKKRFRLIVLLLLILLLIFNVVRCVNVRTLRKEYSQLQYEVDLLSAQVHWLRNKVDVLEEGLEDNQSQIVVARITMYSPLDDRNGINSQGDPRVTASGMPSGPTVVAVDPKKIPYGTRLRIEGFDRTFIAGDTGASMRNYDGIAIDVYADCFEAAMAFGVQQRKIILLDV